MASDAAMNGVLLEEAALTLEELARVCAVEPDWVLQHVQAGVLLADAGQARERWRFTSVDLVRARRLLEVEQVFDANQDVAALVVDLSEEVRRLKARLRVAGLAG
ncbi:MerR family transcriptional regulator [Massilia sp. MB5]|uniref:MerR family transcriptional regulator n=1 Tax=unclassified Massilia TaxID=2609279 RepID=UPI00067D4D5D|nr:MULTISPECIES: MerR family transcriptional regulator [unclassified Massilia]AKU22119.1 MerR family transcriptional regulator [Massilia sp. NR 4-1]UMR33131.1 MerR family transcriptional regulator [Massilia sp. MB5]